MSRSYKNIIGNLDRSPFNKRIANKKVRNEKRLNKSGSLYKKIFDSYNICDYKFLSYSEREFILREIYWINFLDFNEYDNNKEKYDKEIKIRMIKSKSK